METELKQNIKQTDNEKMGEELNEYEQEMLKEDNINIKDDHEEQIKQDNFAQINNDIIDKERIENVKAIIESDKDNIVKEEIVADNIDEIKKNKDNSIKNKENNHLLFEKKNILINKNSITDNIETVLKDKEKEYQDLNKEENQNDKEEYRAKANNEDDSQNHDDQILIKEEKEKPQEINTEPINKTQQKEIVENEYQIAILHRNDDILSLSHQREQYQLELNSFLNKLNNILIKASAVLNQSEPNPEKVTKLEYQLLSQKKSLQKIKSQNKIFKETHKMLAMRSQASSFEKISVLEFKINELQQDNIDLIKKIRELKGTQNVKSKELEGYSANIKFPKEIKYSTEELKSLNNKKREYNMKLNQNKKIIASDLLQVSKIEEIYQKMRNMTNLPNPLPTGIIEYEINRIKYDLKGAPDDIIKRIDNDDMMIVQEQLRKQQWFSPQINTNKKYLKPISVNRINDQSEFMKVNKSVVTKQNKSPRNNNKRTDPYAYFIDHKNKKSISPIDNQSDVIDINKIEDQDLTKITYETLTDYEYRELITKKEHYYDIVFKLENSIREAKKMYERKIKEMSNTLETNSKRLIYIEQENELLRSEINDLSKISKLNIEEKQMKNEINDTNNKILLALQRNQSNNHNQLKNEISESRNEILNELDILDNSNPGNNNQKYAATDLLDEESSSKHHHEHHKIKCKPNIISSLILSLSFIVPDISNVENIDEEKSMNREKVLKDIKSKYIKLTHRKKDNMDDIDIDINNTERKEKNNLNESKDNNDNYEENKEKEKNEEGNIKSSHDYNLEDNAEKINCDEDIVNHQIYFDHKEEKKIINVEQKGNDFKEYEEIEINNDDVLMKESSELAYNRKKIEKGNKTIKDSNENIVDHKENNEIDNQLHQNSIEIDKEIELKDKNSIEVEEDKQDKNELNKELNDEIESNKKLLNNDQVKLIDQAQILNENKEDKTNENQQMSSDKVNNYIGNLDSCKEKGNNQEETHKTLDNIKQEKTDLIIEENDHQKTKDQIEKCENQETFLKINPNQTRQLNINKDINVEKKENDVKVYQVEDNKQIIGKEQNVHIDDNKENNQILQENLVEKKGKSNNINIVESKPCEEEIKQESTKKIPIVDNNLDESNNKEVHEPKSKNNNSNKNEEVKEDTIINELK